MKKRTLLLVAIAVGWEVYVEAQQRGGRGGGPLSALERGGRGR